MKLLLDLAKVLVMFSVCFMCIAAGIFINHTNTTVTNLGSKVSTTIDDVDSTVKRTDLLARQASYLVLNAGLTADQLRKASIKETVMLDTTNATLLKTLTDVDDLVVTSRQTVKDVQPVLEQTKTTIATLDSTAANLNTLMSSPAIAKSLVNIEETTAATALASQHAEGILKDGKEEADKFVHPAKKKLGFWGGVMAGANVAHKFMPPLF